MKLYSQIKSDIHQLFIQGNNRQLDLYFANLSNEERVLYLEMESQKLQQYCLDNSIMPGVLSVIAQAILQQNQKDIQEQKKIITLYEN